MSSDSVIRSDGSSPRPQIAEKMGRADNQALTDPLSTPEPVGANTDALQDTLQRLAVALASIAPEQEQDWMVWTLGELREIREGMGRHADNNEGPDRFLVEVNLAPGLARRGLKLRQDYDDLLLQARMILILLARDCVTEAVDFSLIRQRFELLIQGLHQQETLEKDLIFENLYLDIGTAD